MVRFSDGAIGRVRKLLPELAKFGVVGATGAVVDLGGTAVLYGTFHLGPLTSKAIAITCACVVTYLGSRFWTFRHRENQPVVRELVLFAVLNGIGLIIAEVVIAITAYAFGARDVVAYNAASVLGTGLGTIFRFWAYRKWVFLAPAEPVPATEPVPAYPAPLPPPAAAIPHREAGRGNLGPNGSALPRLPDSMMAGGRHRKDETAVPHLPDRAVAAGRHRYVPGDAQPPESPGWPPARQASPRGIPRER
jgi:putative flippase GtrA